MGNNYRKCERQIDIQDPHFVVWVPKVGMKCMVYENQSYLGIVSSDRPGLPRRYPLVENKGHPLLPLLRLLAAARVTLLATFIPGI